VNDATYVIICVVGMFFVTLSTRSSFFVLPQRFKLPPRFERALRYAPACALTAIIAPSVLTKAPSNHINLDLTNPRLWGVIAGAAFFLWKRNMMAMMAVGLAVFTAVRLATT
jgi:branched-subunit amino acid transport protein